MSLHRTIAPPSLLLLVALALWVAGCSTLPATQSLLSQAEPRVPAAGSYWWYVRFRLNWPEGAEPPWSPDLFIADQVIGPILAAEQGQIALWRFHRRAARDEAGRQFSFIFYAPPPVASRVNAQIAANPQLAQWQRQGAIRTVIYDDPAAPQRPDLDATSDPAWPPAIRRTWPHYIMGVSRLWLELIRDLGRTEGLPGAPQARYAKISASMDALWRMEGGHALVHHLSAMFGYGEIEMVQHAVLRF